ncbi:MAG: hypothetical protein MZU95_17570 [Desulfomicrobium escambiense]|nr:hypothetical protein [Desulfomicrobium escambiense]
MFLHPQEALALIGTNRYKSLRVRLFFIIGALAGVPLILVILIGFVWLRDILDDNFNVQLKWQIESTEKSLEMFLGEKYRASSFSPPPTALMSSPNSAGSARSSPKGKRSSPSSSTSASSTTRASSGPIPARTTCSEKTTRTRTGFRRSSFGGST